MRKLGYTKNIAYMNADEYFLPEEKKLFLKIPHQINSHGKINEYDFNVPENGEYALSHVKLIEVLEPLTDTEFLDRNYSSLLYDTSNYRGKSGLFIKSNHGSYVLDLIKELYIHDRSNAILLLNDYFVESLQCEDIKEISSIFVKQVEQMEQYLEKENIKVDNYRLDYSDFSNIFLNKDDKANEKEFNLLEEKYGEGFDFPAYNDSDYTPMILDGDYCIYDSSGARFFMVKEDSGTKKIYMIYKDRIALDFGKINDWASEFIYQHKQSYIMLKEKITDADLIAEIKEGQLVKSSVTMKTMHLLQNFIVSQLIENGKIINEDIQETSQKNIKVKF